MRKIKAIIALAMSVALLAGCGSSAAPAAAPAEAPAAAPAAAEQTAEAAPASEAEVTWIASCANTGDHPAVQGVMKFAELIEEKSGGRMHMDVFHSAQLASDRDCIEGMQMNTIQCGIMVSSALAGFTDTFLIFDLPFLFENSEQGMKLCQSEVGESILATLDNIGIKGLGFMNYGMRNITNNVRPINAPDDLKGIKIRTMENPIHMAAFSTMGADPTPMAFGELFTALQQGTIDAQENPLSVITSSKFNEVQKYLSVTEHVYSAAPLMVSKAAYDALPDDLKAVVDEAGKEACAWELEFLAQEET
ncbi:MAG: TRAP transporter substrate-binding protein, partial [Clostridia bacterium]|nr:TRAP transporter substrate-binding protein [Clostridia bacterium]